MEREHPIILLQIRRHLAAVKAFLEDNEKSYYAVMVIEDRPEMNARHARKKAMYVPFIFAAKVSD